MTELHFYKKGKAVRLTDQAHALLAVKSDGDGISQKEIASEAILTLVKGKDINKELRTSIEIYEKRVAILAKRIQDNRYAAFGAFVLGAFVGTVLMFCLGAIL